MKALLQRVTGASVSVGDEIVGRIGRGLVIFVGVANGDAERDAQYLAQKTVRLRIFSDEAGRFNLSALDIKGELLVVSQFTLLCNTCLAYYTGRFQQYMQVEIHNDGPVTILLDSREKF